MPTFAYDATNNGDATAGEIEADSVANAIGLIEARGLIVQSIRMLTPNPALVGIEPTRRAVPSSERPAFYRQFDAALAERDKLVPALQALAAEITPTSAGRDVQNLIQALERGATTEDFLNQDALAPWIPLVVSGFSSSTATNRYLQLIEQASRESAARSQRRRLLAYPMIIAALALLVAGFLFATVVPTFRKMFSEFGLSVPFPTAVIIGLSDQIHQHPWRLALTLSVSALIAFLLIKYWLKYALTTRLLGGPTAGNSANVVAMSKFTSALAELLSIDAPLPDALRMAGRASQHRHFRNMAQQLAVDACLPNQSVEQSLRQSPVAHNFPSSVIYALEFAQPNVALLRQLAMIYSDRAGRRSDWRSSWLGPVAILAVGATVGFFLIALFMPLVQMITSLS